MTRNPFIFIAALVIWAIPPWRRRILEEER
jgi:hypothetical protein